MLSRLINPYEPSYCLDHSAECATDLGPMLISSLLNPDSLLGTLVYYTALTIF